MPMLASLSYPASVLARASRRGPQRVDPVDRAQLAATPVSVRRIAALFAPYRWTVAIVMVLIVASSLVSLANPFLVRAVIDRAIPQQNVGLLIALVAAMLAITVVSSVLGVVQTWLSTTVGQRIMHALRSRVFGHLQRQSLSFFTRTRGGEIQSRLTNDIGSMQTVVTSTATSIASNVTTSWAPRSPWSCSAGGCRCCRCSSCRRRSGSLGE
jgi:ATP-binding cassette subfamily B protein